MSDKNETIADIVADIRMQNQGLPEDSNALSPLVCDLLNLADRIEAAAKREMSKMASKNVADFGQFGNAAKLREALENSNGLLEELAAIGEWGESAREQIAENNAALAEPPRNCDVGTAEDKVERFGEYCISHKATLPLPDRCRRCRIRGEMHVHKCIFEWGQMPYEEGGAK